MSSFAYNHKALKARWQTCEINGMPMSLCCFPTASSELEEASLYTNAAVSARIIDSLYFLRIVFGLLVFIGFAGAQTSGFQAASRFGANATGGDLPEFEVATVKPVPPNGNQWGGVQVFPGGRVTLSGLPLQTLVCIAFDLSNTQVSGGEDWARKVFYDLEATPPAELRSSVSTSHGLFDIQDEHLRHMLQALLVDRFQLRFHFATKIQKVYLLTKNNQTTLQLRPVTSTEDGKREAYLGSSIGFSERWVVDRTTMSQLARFASNYVVHSPVIDQTGLVGAFNYTAEPEGWDTYQADPSGSFLGLIRNMGLKLEFSRGPVPLLVVDHADRPSPN